MGSSLVRYGQDALKNLGKRGDVDKDVQPEVFALEPRKGVLGLRKVLALPCIPRSIEGIDVAHLGGNDTVALRVEVVPKLALDVATNIHIEPQFIHSRGFGVQTVSRAFLVRRIDNLNVIRLMPAHHLVARDALKHCVHDGPLRGC